MNSLARYVIFIIIYDGQSQQNTCNVYSNATSKEILDQTLEMYRRDTKHNGLGEIIVFSVLLTPLLAVVTTVTICYIIAGCISGCSGGESHHPPILTVISCCSKNNLKDHSHMSYIASIVQWFLVTLYFIGDNLSPVIVAHGGDIGCVGKCSENVVIVTKVISVASILLLHIVPYILKHCGKANSDFNYVIKDEATLLGLLGNIIKVDAAYTALTAFTQVATFCNDTEEGLNWVVLVACAGGGALYITVKIFNGLQKWDGWFKWLMSAIGFAVLLALLLCYLISDNGTPLDCRFHCDDANGSSGTELSHPLLDRHCCGILGNVITRLVLTIIASALSALVAIVAGVIMCCAYFY